MFIKSVVALKLLPKDPFTLSVSVSSHFCIANAQCERNLSLKLCLFVLDSIDTKTENYSTSIKVQSDLHVTLAITLVMWFTLRWSRDISPPDALPKSFEKSSRKHFWI